MTQDAFLAALQQLVMDAASAEGIDADEVARYFSENGDELRPMIAEILAEARPQPAVRFTEDPLQLWFVDGSHRVPVEMDEQLQDILTEDRSDYVTTVQRLRMLSDSLQRAVGQGMAAGLSPPIEFTAWLLLGRVSLRAVRLRLDFDRAGAPDERMRLSTLHRQLLTTTSSLPGDIAVGPVKPVNPEIARVLARINPGGGPLSREQVSRLLAEGNQRGEIQLWRTIALNQPMADRAAKELALADNRHPDLWPLMHDVLVRRPDGLDLHELRTALGPLLGFQPGAPFLRAELDRRTKEGLVTVKGEGHGQSYSESYRLAPDEAPAAAEKEEEDKPERLGTATYDPTDNKLRLHPFRRLDRDVYDRLKKAGFVWAAKQEVFVAPMWTPEREDLLRELAGDIGDEDESLVDRAQVRSMRFEEYQAKRRAEAEAAKDAVAAIADGIPLGQPILVGHHSERRARKDAERIQAGMRKAVDLWDTSKYWEARAKGAIRSAHYKEAPDVRHRRIKGLEADERKHQKEIEQAEYFKKAWSKPDLSMDRALQIANYAPSGVWGTWSDLRDGKITAAEAAERSIAALDKSIAFHTRWLLHTQHRLAYERAMLGEHLGRGDEGAPTSFAEKWKDVEQGGRVRVGGSWYVVLRVNKKDGKIVSARTTRQYVPIVGVEEIAGYEPPEAGMKEKVKAATALGILVNYPGQGFRHMTRAQWDRAAKFKDSFSVWKQKPSAEHGAYRLRMGTAEGGGIRPVGIYITDMPRVDPPPPEASADKVAATEALAEDTLLRQGPRGYVPRPEPTEFDELRESLRTGQVVKVVQAHQLFPTPAALAERMADEAELFAGARVLEPSAGTGQLLQAVLAAGVAPANVQAVEINRPLAEALRARFPGVAVDADDFLDWDPPAGLRFDRVLMNPPFENAQDIRHIERAHGFLAPGGLLVALCAAGPRQQRTLQPKIIAAGGRWEALPAGSFSSQGTDVRVALVTWPKEGA